MKRILWSVKKKKFISIGFQQPHFRKRYLINENVKYGWEDNLDTYPINVGLGYFYTVCIAWVKEMRKIMHNIYIIIYI